MTKDKYTFSKHERLKSKKEMSRIFTNGIFFYSELMSLGFSKNETHDCHKIAISVPKKLFKSAVKRNKIKRLIRESYRLNKQLLYKNTEKEKGFFNLIFIYKVKKIASYQEIQQNVIQLLKKVNT